MSRKLVRSYLTGLTGAGIFVILFLIPGRAFAAATPAGQWITQQGSGTPTSYGDYLSSSAGLNTYYLYYIEVPSGTGQLVVDIFDADTGGGGAGEAAAGRDAQRGGSWNTSTRYQVRDPTGAMVRNVTVGAMAGLDNVWANLYTTAAPMAGHWELRVDTSSAVTAGDDINAYGVRAHDGTPGAGGTELNVYAYSFHAPGVNNGNPPRSYTLHPYVVDGCTLDSNDFDFDSLGSITFTSRTGAFSMGTGGVSGNDVWVNVPLTGWTADFDATDYGIWQESVTISASGANNFGVVYTGNSRAANPPPTAQPEANTFRIYFPTDAGGAPLKSVLGHRLRWISGPNPPVNGSTTRIEIELTFYNPTPYNIVFTPPNEGIGARVPAAAEVVYADNATGPIRFQPAVGGSGGIVWDPGTVNAGQFFTVTYQVDVTPSAAGQRVPVTETNYAAALMGSMARYADLTGTQFTFGPLCDLAVTEGGGPIPLLTILSSFEAYARGDEVVVEWETASEVGTVGYYLRRKDGESRQWVELNDEMLPGLLHSPQGGTYRYVDETAVPGESYTYKLVEVEGRGRRRVYGPYTVTAGGEGIDFSKKEAERGEGYTAFESVVSRFTRQARGASPAKKLRLEAGRQARREARQKMVERLKQRVKGTGKIALGEDGIVYLDAEEIASLLETTPARAGKMIRRNLLCLRNQGQQAAYLPAEGDAGIYFYGEDIESNYTAENIYWLERGTGLQMEVIEGEGPTPGSGEETFAATVHTEEDHWPLAGIFSDPEADYWFWDYIISGYPGMEIKSFTVPTERAAFEGTATLVVHLQGASDAPCGPDHHVVVCINGVEIGEGSWWGTEAHTLILDFDQELLNDGENTVELWGLLDTCAPYSFFYVDSFDMTYQRYYEAVDDRLLVRGDGNPVVTIKGFTDPAIMVFDVTDGLRPLLVTATTLDEADGSYQVSFRPDSPDHRYLALTADGFSTPSSVIPDEPSHLRRMSNRADYVVITPGWLKEGSRRLADYRRFQGHRTMVVELEDIYDEFNDGIAHPHVVKDFLAYAYYNWRRAPRYVLLIGEGTFDWRDSQGYGDSMVPPLMMSTPDGLFPSDNQFVDVAGDDGIPEMAIGRLPVLTEEELEICIDKIMAYERAGGDWKTHVLMLADDPDKGGDFSAASDAAATLLPAEYTVEKIYLSEHALAEARQLVVDEINTGVGLVNFVGHAALDRLAGEGLLCVDDIESLTNGDRPSIVTAFTCAVNHFAIPGYDCLSEALLLYRGGGAVAVWGPTGLAYHTENTIMNQQFFWCAFQEEEPLLGDVLLRVLEDYAFRGGQQHTLYIYNLLGDPALRIRQQED